MYHNKQAQENSERWKEESRLLRDLGSDEKTVVKFHGFSYCLSCITHDNREVCKAEPPISTDRKNLNKSPFPFSKGLRKGNLTTENPFSNTALLQLNTKRAIAHLQQTVSVEPSWELSFCPHPATTNQHIVSPLLPPSWCQQGPERTCNYMPTQTQGSESWHPIFARKVSSGQWGSWTSTLLISVKQYEINS